MTREARYTAAAVGLLVLASAGVWILNSAATTPPSSGPATTTTSATISTLDPVSAAPVPAERPTAQTPHTSDPSANTPLPLNSTAEVAATAVQVPATIPLPFTDEQLHAAGLAAATWIASIGTNQWNDDQDRRTAHLTTLLNDPANPALIRVIEQDCN